MYYSPKYYCWSMPVIAQPSSGFGVGLMAICWRMGFPFYKDYCIPQKALTSALPFLSTEKRWDVLHLLWLGMEDGDLLFKNALPSNWSRLKCSICLFCSDADWKWNLFSKYSYLKLGYHHRRLECPILTTVTSKRQGPLWKNYPLALDSPKFLLLPNLCFPLPALSK